MPIANNNKTILYGGIGLAVLVVIIIAVMMMKKEGFNAWSPNSFANGSYKNGQGVMGSSSFAQGGSLMLESDANGNLSTSATLPIGAIVIWFGSLNSIPLGWALCDGNNGTPNLTLNNFPLGTNADVNLGLTGGNAMVPMPTHDHQVYYTNDTNTPTLNVDNLTNEILNADVSTPSSANSIYAVGSANTSKTGTGPTDGKTFMIPTLPPYVAVYYIMKMQ
jgi:microcystin-dependent protein